MLEALDLGNRIADLLSGDSECVSIDELPDSVQGPIADLFGFGFDLLTELEVRDEQYKVIYERVPAHACPFCGMEYFDAPGAAREDLDHYLAKGRYAFAAANLRNLVPMGHKCNSKYKQAHDLLRREDGSRRVAFDPYSPVAVQMGLDESEPFGGDTEYTPDWRIRFEPDSPAVSTWDEVFSLRARYRRDYLNPSFRRLLNLFAQVSRRDGLRGDSDEEVVAALKRLEVLFSGEGFADRGFLKAAVFRMLRRHCEAGHRRLLDELRDLIKPPEQ